MGNPIISKKFPWSGKCILLLNNKRGRKKTYLLRQRVNLSVNIFKNLVNKNFFVISVDMYIMFMYNKLRRCDTSYAEVAQW